MFATTPALGLLSLLSVIACCLMMPCSLFAGVPGFVAGCNSWMNFYCVLAAVPVPYLAWRVLLCYWTVGTAHMMGECTCMRRQLMIVDAIEARDEEKGEKYFEHA